MRESKKHLISTAKEACDIVRYPYTHHGPPVFGSKLEDYLISEAHLREDHPDFFEGDTGGLEVIAVKPLEWDGFRSGAYEIYVQEGGIANLLYHFGGEEPEYVKGGYLTLVSMDDLKAAAQKHHEEFVLSAIETGDHSKEGS